MSHEKVPPTPIGQRFREKKTIGQQLRSNIQQKSITAVQVPIKTIKGLDLSFGEIKIYLIN
jgi:hypothetical protein